MKYKFTLWWRDDIKERFIDMQDVKVDVGIFNQYSGLKDATLMDKWSNKANLKVIERVMERMNGQDRFYTPFHRFYDMWHRLNDCEKYSITVAVVRG